MNTVYVADPVPFLEPFAAERAAVAAAGAELVLGDPAEPRLQDAEVILITEMAVTAPAIRSLKRCRMIARYGIGVDTIDVAVATERGIVVANAPTHSVREVADHTVALILSFARRIPWLDRQVREGRWSAAQAETWGVRRMDQLTIGIVGLGRIGQLVAKRLAPFGCRLIACDPSLDAAEIQRRGAHPAAWNELLAQADIVTVHVPLGPATRRLIDERALARMKPTAVLVNASRGGVVDEAAMVAALQTGRLFGVALDVLDPEPPSARHALLQLDPMRVVLTPHFAAASLECYPALQAEVAVAIAALLSNRWPAGTINRDVRPKVSLG